MDGGKGGGGRGPKAIRGTTGLGSSVDERLVEGGIESEVKGGRGRRGVDLLQSEVHHKGGVDLLHLLGSSFRFEGRVGEEMSAGMTPRIDAGGGRRKRRSRRVRSGERGAGRKAGRGASGGDSMTRQSGIRRLMTSEELIHGSCRW